MFEALQQLVLPDEWQAEAITHLREGRDVILNAPTGAGKTYVFEKLIESGYPSGSSKGSKNKGGGQVVYTVPTRALANDKFAQWQQENWRVGIVTGDVSINPTAPVIVATLEAVQGIATSEKPPRLLVIDEYQWIADEARGNHYEGVIATAPPNVQLLLMSGSVGNPKQVAQWLHSLRRDVRICECLHRPVPIEEMNLDDLNPRAPRDITGYWNRCIAGALREDLGPILIFTPQRKDAEKLARQLASALPPSQPLTLSGDQEQLVRSELRKVLEKRIAYHHSGLSYAERAGVVEPLAKLGQLRVVVATLGLSTGINFSLRSVMITANNYRSQEGLVEILPHELLQMIGRAGRRGMDERGYLLVNDKTPRLAQSRQMRLRRAEPVPWTFLLRRIAAGADVVHESTRFGESLYTYGNSHGDEEWIPMGCEETSQLLAEQKIDQLPCGHFTDTGRARLVKRKRRPFAGCKACEHRRKCQRLSGEPTILWQWTRLGILNKSLQITGRGLLTSFFLGPEGLAIAAAVEDRKYPIDEVVVDLANVFCGERFAGEEPRWSGRLALCCQKAYDRMTIEGFLQWGVPATYGYGGCEVVKALISGERKNRTISKDKHASVHTSRGDIDRLLTEWRSLLRQIAAAPALNPEIATELQSERWSLLQQAAAKLIEEQPDAGLPDLPPLTPAQREPVSHKLRW